MPQISRLARLQPHNLTHADAPEAQKHQKLLPPQYFERSPTSLDPENPTTSQFSTFPAQDERNISLSRHQSTNSTTAPSSTPCAIVKPLSVQIPKMKNNQFKSKDNISKYYRNLISYNELLKQKELYLNNLLMKCPSQALFIDVSSLIICAVTLFIVIIYIIAFCVLINFDTPHLQITRPQYSN